MSDHADHNGPARDAFGFLGEFVVDSLQRLLSVVTVALFFLAGLSLLVDITQLGAGLILGAVATLFVLRAVYSANIP